MQKWTRSAQLRFQHRRHAPQYYQAQGEAVSSSVCRPCNYLLPPSGIKVFVLGGLELIFAFLHIKIALFSKLVLDTFKVSSLPNLCEMNLRLTQFFPHRYVVVSSKKVWHLPFISLVTVWPFSGWQNIISRADTVLVIVEGVRNMCFSRCGQIQLVSAHFGFQPFWWLARPLRQCHIDTTATEASSKSTSRRTGVYRRARVNLQRELPNVAKEASKKLSMVCFAYYDFPLRKNGN